MSSPIDLSLVPTDNLEAFERSMAELERKGRKQFLIPRLVHLNGNTGEWMQKVYDTTSRKRETKLFGTFGESWDGVILLVRWFCSSKHNPDATEKKQTREFVLFEDEPIVLEKWLFSKTAKMRVERLATYEDYQAYKTEYSHTDKMRDKNVNDFDLWASVYVYLPEEKQVVNVQMKGDGRSSVFDYRNEYSSELPEHPDTLSRVITHFDKDERKKTQTKKLEAGEKETYFAPTLKAFAMTEGELRSQVMRATIELAQWLKFSDSQGSASGATALPVAGSVDDEDTRYQPTGEDVEQLMTDSAGFIKKLGREMDSPDAIRRSMLAITGYVLEDDNSNLPAIWKILKEKAEIADIPF